VGEDLQVFEDVGFMLEAGSIFGEKNASSSSVLSGGLSGTCSAKKWGQSRVTE
jgi:hypothetical protein